MESKLDKRRKKILSILSEIPISSTQQLAKATNVSNETMRKDLDALSDEGHIIKVHGGVALAHGTTAEIPFDLRAAKNAAQKREIAKAASGLIEVGDTILLESCTTNLELARVLIKDPDLLETLVVITNSFSIASLFDRGTKCRRMFFLGGWINPEQYSVLGPQTARMLSDFHVSKAFLSGAALSRQFILTGYYDADVDFQKSALNAAQEVILMIDNSKFEQTAIYTVAPLSQADYLITDRLLTEDEQAYIDRENIHYIHA